MQTRLGLIWSKLSDQKSVKSLLPLCIRNRKIPLVWSYSRNLGSTYHLAWCLNVNKQDNFDLQVPDSGGPKWPKLVKMGYVNSVHISHWVDFLYLGNPFGQLWSLRVENFEIAPFLTKWYKIFIFVVFLFSKVTI